VSPTETPAETPIESAAALGRVGAFVDDQVRDLQSRFLRERQDPAAVAALARLRRAVGKPPGEVMDVLEFTFHAGLAADHHDDQPTPAEWAAHVAITLFAAHQQSRGERMHRRGRGLGTALRALHTGDPAAIPDPITRRFRMLGTADSFGELTHHLRGVVQLLRAAGEPLDYGRLGQQLHTWQSDRGQVRMTWGRQFYRQNRAAATATADVLPTD
jgi:CRISPR system Cascade subunit CasB